MELVESMLGAGAIEQATSELPDGFEPNGVYGESLPEMAGPGAIPDIVDFGGIVCFGVAADVAVVPPLRCGLGRVLGVALRVFGADHDARKAAENVDGARATFAAISDGFTAFTCKRRPAWGDSHLLFDLGDDGQCRAG